MKIVETIHNFVKIEQPKSKKEAILKYLKELQNIEAKLWGVTIKQVTNGEDKILEDTNHLIYLVSRNNYHTLKKILNKIEIKDFLKELKDLRKDFLYLKKKIEKKNRLKNLIANFTIKLVEPNNFIDMENIFLLEKKLYEILDNQQREINELIEMIPKLKINTKNEKIDVFINSLKELRVILSAHHDINHIFEEDRQGYSTVSNIINNLIKTVKNKI